MSKAATDKAIIFMNHRIHDDVPRNPITIRWPGRGRRPSECEGVWIEGASKIVFNPGGNPLIKTHLVKVWVEAEPNDVAYEASHD